MTTAKPWGRIGDWALEAERAEDEEREAATAAALSKQKLSGESSHSFPSLKEAVATKTKKKKVPMPLSVFTTGTAVGPGAGRLHSSSEHKGLTTEERFILPTAPKQRSPEELEDGRLGGGFRSYGMGVGRTGMSGRRDEGDGSWGQGGPPGRMSDFDMQPSRADEADNWAASKKFTLLPADFGRQDRHQSHGSGGSRADELDNWALGKKRGIRDSPAPGDSDRWVRGGGGGSLPGNVDRERPKLVLDPPKGDVGVPSEPARTRPNPFGAARPREQVLAEKGVDWRKADSEIETKKTSRPTSSQSSRPSSAHSNRPESPDTQLAVPEVVTRTRPKVNPFCDAKPREFVLEEHGKDWRKIDMELEHRGVSRSETAEEKILKEEINQLKDLSKESGLELDGQPTQHSQEQLTSIHEQILRAERDLELLIRNLDDKVRFGQRTTSDIRPGSGAGRTTIFSERPPSQSGRSEESRSKEFMERARSRGGMGDMWSKSVDDRRAFQRCRDGGFFGNRNMDRSRERW